MTRAASPSGRVRQAAGLTALSLTLLWTVWFFYGIGPERVPPPRWYAPSGFIHDALPSEFLPGVQEFLVAHTSAEDEVRVENLLLSLAFCLVPAGLAVGVFWGLRSGFGRTFALFSVLATFVLGYYGMQATRVWEFFGWRWSACILLFCLAVAAALGAPFLARSWLARSWPVRVLLYLPLLFGLVVVMRNTTGTDPSLPFNISPWPAASWFGVEIGGAVAGTAVALVAVGLAALASLRRTPWRGVAGLAVVVATPLVFLTLGSGTRLVMLGLCLAGGVWAAGSLSAFPEGENRPLERGAALAALGAVLALLPVLLGLVVMEQDYLVTRNHRAGLLMTGLESYFERESLYPDDLSELRVAGDLRAVPAPRIGFQLGSEEEFTYQNLGTSYLLEFVGPRWVQCTYSSPYADEEWEEEDEIEPGDEEDLDLAGAWSCPSRPPELW